MPVSRCPHCAAVLTEEEAAAASCPACAAPFLVPEEPEPLAVEALPLRRPWASWIACAVLTLAVVSLWLTRPAAPDAPPPPEEADAYRDALSAKESAQDEARKLRGELALARKGAARLGGVEKALAALKAEAEGQRVAWEKKLADAVAKAEAVEKALEEERAKGAPGGRVDDPRGTRVVEPVNNGDKVRLTGRVGTLVVKGVNDGELDASGLEAKRIIVEGAVNGRSVLKLRAPGGTVKLAGLNSEARAEIDAPGGTVETGDLNSESRLKVRAKEMRFSGAVQGNAQASLTVSGKIAFKLIQGSSKVRWKKDGTEPAIEEGEVRGEASFAKEE